MKILRSYGPLRELNAHSYSHRHGHWSVGVAVKNILNRAYPQSVIYSAASGARAYGLNDPRTVLFSLSYEL